MVISGGVGSPLHFSHKGPSGRRYVVRFFMAELLTDIFFPQSIELCCGGEVIP